MRIEQSEYNPLHDILKLIPDEGVHLSRENLINLGNIFKVGGVVPETYQEVIHIIQLLEEWYQLVNIEHKDGKYYLLRKNNGETAQ